MTATIQYIEQKFNEFNDMCFGGVLPMPPIVTTDAKTFLGLLSFTKEIDQYGNIIRYYDFKLTISTKIDLPEAEVEDTIIHEMIHYYIAFYNLYDASAHGATFKGMMTAINNRFNRNVSIVHHSTQEEIEQDQELKSHILCITSMDDGTMGLTVVARTRVFDVYESIKSYPRATNMAWYHSVDPYFNRFPKSTNGKIYSVDMQELVGHLQGAEPLICDGKSLKKKR